MCNLPKNSINKIYFNTIKIFRKLEPKAKKYNNNHKNNN